MPARRRNVRKKNFWHGGVAGELATQYGIDVPKIDPKLKLISPNEAAPLFGVTGEAIKQWIYRGKIPAVKQGNGYWKLKVEDIETFIRQRQEDTKGKILLLGISHELQSLIERACHELFDVVIANSATDALLKSQALRPMLYILDITGSEDAWAAARQFRQRKETRSIPILFIGPKEFPQSKVNEALELRIEACVPVPINPKTIKREICSLTSRRV